MNQQAAPQPDMHLFPSSIAFDNNALAGLKLLDALDLGLMKETLDATQA